MMIKKISEIFEITRGFSFKQAIKPEENGNTKAVQAGNLKDNIEIDRDGIIMIDGTNISTRAIVGCGDVILSSRGNLRAGIADSSLDGAIASASTFILRLKDKNILPEYVAAYLNSSQGQDSLKRASSSISITALATSELENIKIPVPDMKKQKIFTEMYKNKVRQQEILEIKIKAINAVVEGSIKKILK
jgi:restriction endonuclease S subunit